MNTQPQTRYIKTFNKGQMTIPKDFREDFGIGDESWLKLYAQGGKIIMEPIKEDKKFNREEWRKQILSIKGVWDLRAEVKKSRAETEKRLRKNAL